MTSKTEQEQPALMAYGARHGEIIGLGRQVVIYATDRWNPETQQREPLSFFGWGTVANKHREDLGIDMEAVALARKIMAVDDLLAACKAYIATTDGPSGVSVYSAAWDACEAAIRAAVAKAEAHS